MKNIQLTLEDIGCKVLVAGLLAGFFFTAGLISSIFFQPPFAGEFLDTLPVINGVISVIVALFAWSVFHLIEPVHHSRRWLIAEYIVIPFLWLLLMAAIDLWIYYVIQTNLSPFVDVKNNL